MTNKHDFTGKSIKCDTWEQMLHLAKLAEEQEMGSGGFSKRWFDDNGGIYFETTSKMYYLNLQKPQEKVIIKYSDFINPSLPTEVVEITGCVDCPFHVGLGGGNFCEHPSYIVSSADIFTTCPLKKASLTIQLKHYDTTIIHTNIVCQ